MPLTLETSRSVDVLVTRDRVVNGLPARPDRRQVNGVVYEMAATGRRPRPGVGR